MAVERNGKENILTVLLNLITENEATAVFDLHNHTRASNDATKTFQSYLDDAAIAKKSKGVDFIGVAFTNHNSVTENISDMMVKGVPLDTVCYEDKKTGTLVIPSVEVTVRSTRVVNKNGRAWREHWNIFGLDFKNSPLVEVLMMKEINDFVCDFGRLMYMLKKSDNGKLFTEEYVKNCIQNYLDEDHSLAISSKKVIARFLDEHKITLSKSYRSLAHAGMNKHITPEKKLEHLMDDLSKGYTECKRMDLLDKDVALLAHYSGNPEQCGAIIIGNHPTPTLKKARDATEAAKSMVSYVDGIEVRYPDKNAQIDSMLWDAARHRRKRLVKSAGGDRHHGNKRAMWTDASELTVLDALEDIQYARDNGCPTSYHPPQPTAEEVERIRQHYRNEFKTNTPNYAGLADLTRNLMGMRYRQLLEWYNWKESQTAGGSKNKSSGYGSGDGM